MPRKKRILTAEQIANLQELIADRKRNAKFVRCYAGTVCLVSNTLTPGFIIKKGENYAGKN